MNWNQIKQPEDPEWLEYHCEVISPFHGRSMLKVWRSFGGFFQSSLTSLEGNRSVQLLRDATSIEEAKAQAYKWATTTSDNAW